MRLKDIRQLLSGQDQRVTAKLDDGEIYEIRRDFLIGGPQPAVIKGEEADIHYKKSLIKNMDHILTIKVGSKLVAERDVDGQLRFKRSRIMYHKKENE